MDTIDEILQLIDIQAISQTELARISGINQTTLWKNLTRKTKMNVDTYKKILSALSYEIKIIKSNSDNNTEYSDYLAEPHKDNYKSNDDFLDRIKNQEKTIHSQQKTIENL